MFLVRRIVIILTLCATCLSIYYSVLFARADSLRLNNTLDALRSVVLLVPGNAEYHALLAEHLEVAGLNPDSELALATQLSPREGRFWIRRGFRAEVEQKYAESESYLLEARKADNGFDPRSALMNYYFRRGKFPEFWKSAHDSLEMSYGDLSPIFRLTLAANDDPAATRAILPPGGTPLISLLRYLLNTDRLESAARIAPEASASATKEDIPLLLDYCERQAGHDENSAVLVWNAMCGLHLLPFDSLSPGAGRIVTNGDFRGTLHRGYDWKFPAAEGATISPLDSGGEAIALNGNQPDRIVLLQQRIPLTAGKVYFVEYQYRLDGAAGDSGLRWIVEGTARDGAPDQGAAAPSSTLEGSNWHTGRMTFAGSAAGSGTLSLEYQRTLATIRWRGSLQLRHVTAGIAAEK